jgi:hypothetical protein
MTPPMDQLRMRIYHDKQPGGNDATLNAALEGIAALRGAGSSKRHAAAIEGSRP